MIASDHRQRQAAAAYMRGNKEVEDADSHTASAERMVTGAGDGEGLDALHAALESKRVARLLSRRESTAGGYQAAMKDFVEVANKLTSKQSTLQRDRVQLLVNFVKDGGDFAGAFNGVLDWGWSDLVNGLVGINSASISLYRLWARYDASIEKQIAEKRRLKLKAMQEEAERAAKAELER